MNTIATNPEPAAWKTHFRRGCAVFCHIHFWLWNILFCVISLSAILPHVFIDCTLSFFSGEMPAGIYLGIVGILIIPLLSIVVGIFKVRDVTFLGKFFYGIELPTMALLTLCSFLLKDNSFSAGLFLFLCLFCLVFLTLRLFKKETILTRNGWLESTGMGVLLWSGYG